MSSMEEISSGTLTPTSSTSTAVEQQTNGLLYPKSPLLNDEAAASLGMGRRASRPRERRSFSSAQKLPILEPSSSRLRRQFDYLLLWILQSVMLVYVTVVAWRNRLVYTAWSLWYDWHAWSYWGRYMIQWDVSGLRKLPRHVAVILDVKKMRREYDADETVRKVIEFASWCACAGIPIVTIFEPTGLLKKDVKRIQSGVQKSIATYSPKSTQYKVDVHTPQTVLLTNTNIANDRDMEILVISHEDSRLPIVDLARTLGDMNKQEKLFPEDITIELIHENLTENLMTDPDLLILFAPRVELQGFPPWQIRLTEIFHLPDNKNFGYSVFIQGLRMYDRAEMRFGR